MKTILLAGIRLRNYIVPLVVFTFFVPLLSYSQTFFGVSANPADNAAHAGPTTAITPPAAMVAGDLVIVYAHYRATGATITMPTTGGQTWTTETTMSASTQTFTIFWCRYNGLWAANPVVSVGAGALGFTAVMYVYRPTNSNSTWAINVAATNSSSNTLINSITGITTTAPNTVTMAFWGNAAANTWGTLTGAGWSNTGLSAQYRNTTGGQSHTAAYNINAAAGAVANVSQRQSAATTTLRSIIAWYEMNDACAAAYPLTSGTTCTSVTGSLYASNPTALVPGACGNPNSADVWYSFTAQTAYPTITLANLGASFSGASPRIHLLSGTCGGWTSLSCVAGTTMTTNALNGGAGLSPGTTYFIRIATNTNTGIPAGGYAAWDFDICITDPVSTNLIDYSKCYINVTKGTSGGTIDPGDILEFRATFVVRAGAVDSLAYYDTLVHSKGFAYVTSSLATKTNEGKNYNIFNDAVNTDPGDVRVTGLDTAIRINFGTGASGSARGKIRNTSFPSFYNSACIIMATYRVRVYGTYGTKIEWGGGRFTYRDTITGVINSIGFPTDSLIVYSSPGLCPNAVSATNAVGVESNGTFGVPATGAPLARNRSTSSYVPGYTYSTFVSGGGPQDYYYGVANNTSARYTILQNWAKPDPGSPNYRVFSLWDIIGDHTGATNTAKGNPPCDTTKPVSATNPCGYMLVINSAFKTDTAFQYTISSLCPNTYYEISAWVRNICYRCGCDSLGRGSGTAGYIPFATGDSSGVQPNLAFDIDGIDYYSTGNIPYYGTDITAPRDTTSQRSDTLNRWVKRGFTFLTGPSQTSFTLTIRNNAPGGGGNDWAMDDISVATCLPNMKYSPSNNPNVCRLNPLTIYDTVRAFFNNYVYYKWQRSTNNGSTWTDVTGPLGPATPTWNGTAWQYTTSYTIPVSNADTSDSGDLYRLIVATTSANLANSNCQVSDGTAINLTVLNCGVPLKTDLLSFSGRLVNTKANLSWTTSKEDEPLTFTVERSDDGNNFTTAGTMNSHNNYIAETNLYSFVDPVAVTGKEFYRIILTDRSNTKKYSRTIRLGDNNVNDFTLSNVINPFNYTVDFDVTSRSETRIDVELLDLFGKIVKNNSYVVHAGVNVLSLPGTENLPAGTYIFRIKNNEMFINRKVLKKGF